MFNMFKHSMCRCVLIASRLRQAIAGEKTIQKKRTKGVFISHHERELNPKLTVWTHSMPKQPKWNEKLVVACPSQMDDVYIAGCNDRLHLSLHGVWGFGFGSWGLESPSSSRSAWSDEELGDMVALWTLTLWQKLMKEPLASSKSSAPGPHRSGFWSDQWSGNAAESSVCVNAKLSFESFPSEKQTRCLLICHLGTHC